MWALWFLRPAPTILQHTTPALLIELLDVIASPAEVADGYKWELKHSQREQGHSKTAMQSLNSRRSPLRSMISVCSHHQIMLWRDVIIILYGQCLICPHHYNSVCQWMSLEVMLILYGFWYTVVTLTWGPSPKACRPQCQLAQIVVIVHKRKGRVIIVVVFLLHTFGFIFGTCIVIKFLRKIRLKHRKQICRNWWKGKVCVLSFKGTL